MNSWEDRLANEISKRIAQFIEPLRVSPGSRVKLAKDFDPRSRRKSRRRRTSTAWAPWYVIPADRKWFARIAAAAVIAHTLIEIDAHYPTLGDDALRDLEAAKGRLEAEAPGAAAEPFERKEPEEPRSNSHVAHFTRAGAPAGKDD
jgi:Polyphosphate kinase 2 (PPK2)